MRVLVCGGRDFNDNDWIWNALLGIEWIFDKRIQTIIHGGARGADQGGAKWGVTHGREVLTFIADWKNLGKSAGFIRNKAMLVDGKPDIVLAMPGGKGTAHTVKLAKQMNIPTIEVNDQKDLWGDCTT